MTDRDPRRQPFGIHSIWNQPISLSAQYTWAEIQVTDPDDPANPTKFFRRTVSDQNQIHFSRTDSVDRNVDETDRTFGPGVDGAERVANRVIPVNTLVTAPYPVGFQTYNTEAGQPWDDWRTSLIGGNNACGVYRWNGSSWEIVQFSPAESDGNVIVCGHFNERNRVPVDDELGIFGTHGGSGLSSVGGSILHNELVPGGEINKVTTINIWGATSAVYDPLIDTPGFIWPAIRADSYAGDPGGPESRGYGTQRSLSLNPTPDIVRMGCLFALKPTGPLSFEDTGGFFGPAGASVNISSLQTEPARILARAWLIYGCRWVDDSNRNAISINSHWWNGGSFLTEFTNTWGWDLNQEWNGATGNGLAWLQDMQGLFGNLHVIANDDVGAVWGGGPEWSVHSTNIGGGPTSEPEANRRAPYAKPIAVDWWKQPSGGHDMATPGSSDVFVGSM